IAPKPVTALCGVPLDFITAGGDHSFAVSLPGSVYGWGRNTAGQLGLGRIDAKGESLCGVPVAQIAAGGNHSFVLSVSGAVYGWGRNNAGQLGLGDTNGKELFYTCRVHFSSCLAVYVTSPLTP
uniref:Regulator of chromosome condensation 1 n=1 Tax=Erpetoichthys calabaricus TaxID=27687 RepID=A0A8C4RLU5_ERPCA